MAKKRKTAPRGCLVCGKPRPELAVAAGDPFCSADCCRAHHETALATLEGVLPARPKAATSK